MSKHGRMHEFTKLVLWRCWRATTQSCFGLFFNRSTFQTSTSFSADFSLKDLVSHQARKWSVRGIRKNIWNQLNSLFVLVWWNNHNVDTWGRRRRDRSFGRRKQYIRLRKLRVRCWESFIKISTILTSLCLSFVIKLTCFCSLTQLSENGWKELWQSFIKLDRYEKTFFSTQFILSVRSNVRIH